MEKEKKSSENDFVLEWGTKKRLRYVKLKKNQNLASSLKPTDFFLKKRLTSAVVSTKKDSPSQFINSMLYNIFDDVVPNAELQHLRNSLPDSVVVLRIEERLSALGNYITCNDHVALTHTDLDRVHPRTSIEDLVSFRPFCKSLW
ncbi:Eukaryotic translation initiation factor 6 (Fragment) [Linum perenne]